MATVQYNKIVSDSDTAVRLFDALGQDQTGTSFTCDVEYIDAMVTLSIYIIFVAVIVMNVIPHIYQ